MRSYSFEEEDYSAGERVTFSEEGIGANPFPGLRPFTLRESHLFFGREKQIEEVMLKLVRNRAVAVMGHSGSGKSSLLSCGLIPILLRGFMTEHGSSWRVVSVRPGNTPIHNLAEALTDSFIQNGKADYADQKIESSLISSMLQQGQDGLLEAVKFMCAKNENFFLLVDQFEEIFRYQDADDPSALGEAAMYVNLIQTAVSQRETPIFIVFCMRSDFIGQCSVFEGLTKIINGSNYLVPQMAREHKRLAIEGPVAVGGGQVSKRLVQRILADISDSQDQLTVMQHALMRTWNYWKENHEENEPMDIRHYNAIGKVAQALSLHANEAFDELTPREKGIAEILFKSLTERTQEGLEVRRMIRVSTVAQLAEAGEEEVIKVVETFRFPERSFIMPGSNVALHGETVLELAHESLMHIWTRLSAWVTEEFESAKMYKRIAEAASMYQVGKTNLWRPPDLQLALNWQMKQQPTRLWAQRYAPAFERALVFLDTSRMTYDAEIRNQEMLHHRNLLRARRTSIILSVAGLIAICFAVYGIMQQIAAEGKAVEAQLEKNRAERAFGQVHRQKTKIDSQLQITKMQAEDIKDKQSLLQQNYGKLQVALEIAENQKQIAQRAEWAAKDENMKADIARKSAEHEFRRAEANLSRANSLLMLSIAQSMEAKSVSIEDPELAGLTAMQGYKFHEKFGGKDYDPYIFRGLYTALTKALGTNYHTITCPGGLKNRMLALAISRKGSAFYASGTDGRIVRGDYLSFSAEVMASNSGYPNRVLALNDTETYLANGNDSTDIEIFNLPEGYLEKKVKPHKALVTDIQFFPRTTKFVSSAMDGTLAVTDVKSGFVQPLSKLPFDVKAIDISPDGKEVLIGSSSGSVGLVNLATGKYVELFNESPNRVLSVVCHPFKKMIAAGMEALGQSNIVVKGMVKLYDLTSAHPPMELTRHTAGVSDLEFNQTGDLLASASLDGRVQVWVTERVEDLPLVMNSNGYVWKLAFTSDGKSLLAAGNNGEIRVWPTQMSDLADRVCPTLKRNLTTEEWSVYVGNKIEYESTCAEPPKTSQKNAVK